MHLLFLALLLIPVQEDIPTISAIGTQFVGDTWSASGDVVATWRDIRVETEILEYDRSTQSLTADGGVTLIQGTARLTGSRLDMRVDTRAGILSDAEGVIGDLRVTAREVHRREDGLYEVFDAVVVLCDENGNSVLELTTSRSEIDPDDYLRSFNNILRFQGVPILWLPYMRTALGEQPRTSGFLLPQTSTSTTRGRSVSDAFYWAINRSADLTLRGEYFSKRGMGGGIEYRMVPSQNSRIRVRNVFAYDRLGQGGQRTEISALASTPRLRMVADLDVVSSFEFRQVFEEDFNVISSPTERSRAFGTYTAPGVTYNFSYDRQGTFFENQQTAIVRKLPAVEAVVETRPIARTPLYFTLTGGVAAIHRRDAVTNSPPLVGRLDVSPRLDLPLFRGLGFAWSHSVGIRETLYSHDRDAIDGPRVLSRFAFDYGFDLSGPYFSREFGRWTHLVGPEIEYRYVAGIDAFEDTFRVDETDLLVNTHEVRYGITNRFLNGRDVLTWSLAQKYFLEPGFGGALVPGRDNVFGSTLDLTGFGFADQGRRFSPIVSVLRYDPGGGRAADLQLDYDVSRNEFRSGGLIGRFQAGPTSYGLAYFLIRESPIQIESHQIRATLGYRGLRQPGLSGSVAFSYNVDRSFFQTTTVRVGYNTACYGVLLEFSQFDVGSRKESQIRFAFSLRDLGTIGDLPGLNQLF